MDKFNYYDNKLFFFIRKFTECVEASFLWLVCCLPIVTIGASSAAFYAVMHGAIRRDRDTVWSNFWRIFRKYFRKSTAIWLVMLVALAVAALGWLFTYEAMKAGHPLGGWNPMFLIPVVFVAAIAQYAFPYLVRFETDARHVAKNAFHLAVVNLHWTILMLLLLIPAGLSLYINPIAIFIAPGAVCLIDEIILERIFRRVMRPEDLQKEIEREKREREERYF